MVNDERKKEVKKAAKWWTNLLNDFEQEAGFARQEVRVTIGGVLQAGFQNGRCVRSLIAVR